MTKLMLDLCSGLGGASAAFRLAGWEVFTVDNNPEFSPTWCGDVRKFTWRGGVVDFIWASPPCTEFSRESMPWCKTGAIPDISIVLACRDIIRSVSPDWWVIENVKGSLPWLYPVLGSPAWVSNPYYLWGNLPFSKISPGVYRGKERMSSGGRALRSCVPFSLSRAVLSLTSQLRLDL